MMKFGRQKEQMKEIDRSELGISGIAVLKRNNDREGGETKKEGFLGRGRRLRFFRVSFTYSKVSSTICITGCLYLSLCVDIKRESERATDEWMVFVSSKGRF